MPWRTLYSARATGAWTHRPPSRAADQRRTAGRAAGSGGWTGCEPCCQSRTAPASRPSLATSPTWASRCTPPTGPASTSPTEGIAVASVNALTDGQTTRRRPGQDLPPRGLRGHPGPARQARAAGRARDPGHRPDRPRHRQRQALRPGHRGQAHRHRRGHRDDRRRRGGAPRGRRPQLGRRRRRVRPVALLDHRRRAPPARRRQPRAARAPGGRGVQHGRRLPRRDRRLPQPDRRQHLPEPAGPRPREGRRPALRREPAPARRVLPRDDPSQRHPGRRQPAAGRAAVVQQPARPRCRVPHRPRLHGPDRGHRQAHRPGRAGLRTTSSSRPTGTPSRPTRSRPSAASSGSTASSTARPPGRSPRTRTRRSWRPGFSEAAIGILRGKAGLEILAVPPDPTDGMRDYGIANLDFKRVAGGLLVESRSTSSGSTAAISRSSPSAARRSRS